MRCVGARSSTDVGPPPGSLSGFGDMARLDLEPRERESEFSFDTQRKLLWLVTEVMKPPRNRRAKLGGGKVERAGWTEGGGHDELRMRAVRFELGKPAQRVERTARRRRARSQ